MKLSNSISMSRALLAVVGLGMHRLPYCLNRLESKSKRWQFEWQ
jgi:hypothetical protein